MKNINLELTRQFVNEGSPSRALIEGILCFGGIVSILVMAIGAYRDISFYVFIPLLALSVIIYFLSQKVTNSQRHYINFLAGISGIVACISCSCASLLISPLTLNEIWKYSAILILVNSTGILYAILRARKYAKSKSKSNVISVAGTIVSGSIVLGMSIGKVLYASIDLSLYQVSAICLSIASWIFSFSFIFIMRYYYYKVLQKTENAK